MHIKLNDKLTAASKLGSAAVKSKFNSFIIINWHRNERGRERERKRHALWFNDRMWKFPVTRSRWASSLLPSISRTKYSFQEGYVGSSSATCYIKPQVLYAYLLAHSKKKNDTKSGKKRSEERKKKKTIARPLNSVNWKEWSLTNNDNKNENFLFH